MTKRFQPLTRALALGTIAILLSGCGGGSTAAIPSGTGAATARADRGGYQTIYDFASKYKNGDEPNGQLLALNGVLYGTTYFGGREGHGTVYSLTPSGEERVIHRFTGGSDGANPNAGLIAAGGVLYGTTHSGGGGCAPYSGCGTVFSLTTSGEEHVLYRFKGGSDGYLPAGSLTWLHGELYGATAVGGIAQCPQSGYGTGCGTIFSVDTAGNEKVLYRFLGNNDGVGPNAPLLATDGTLYGTTTTGGGGSGSGGNGIIFAVTTSGVETVLHRFQGGTDGSFPVSPLIYLGGMLYGTTGGAERFGGTVFKSTLSGDESPIYSFKKLPDAQSPRGELTVYHGVLYGTASGGKTCEEYFMSGTIFAVTTEGAERVVYTYPCKPLSDVSPSLLLFDGVLYGTTSLGGKGKGTVFAFTP